MTQIKPITELRNTTEISDICHRKKEPIFITKNGYGDMVVMSIEAYDELIETIQTDTEKQLVKFVLLNFLRFEFPYL